MTQNKTAVQKIGSLKKGTRFEMDGRQYVITRSGRGYPDVEFKLISDTAATLTTIHKNNTVKVV